MVSDDGDPILSSTTTITLTVTDVNDNPPELMLTEFSLSTSVDTVPGYLPHFALFFIQQAALAFIRTLSFQV